MYLKNQKFSVSPSLKTDYLEYVDKSLVVYGATDPSPAFGFKKFCNLSECYTFFVASKVPKIKLSLCSVGVFGLDYARKESIKNFIQISDDQFFIFVSHVFAQIPIDHEPEFNLSKNAGSKLTFVTFRNRADSTDVFINAKSVDPRVYNLVLESLDLKGILETILIDRITNNF